MLEYDVEKLSFDTFWTDGVYLSEICCAIYQLCNQIIITLRQGPNSSVFSISELLAFNFPDPRQPVVNIYLSKLNTYLPI